MPPSRTRPTSEASHESARGFSLVEMIAVIVLVGILLAAAAPRLSGLTEVGSKAAPVDEVISVLRLAQQQAMTRARRVEVKLENNNGGAEIQLKYCKNFLEGDEGWASCPDSDPDTDKVDLTLPTGEKGEWTIEGNLQFKNKQTFYFSPLGRVLKASGNDWDEEQVSIEVGSQEILVEQETGYAYRP